MVMKHSALYQQHSSAVGEDSAEFQIGLEEETDEEAAADGGEISYEIILHKICVCSVYNQHLEYS